MTVIGVDPGVKTGLVVGKWVGLRFVPSWMHVREFTRPDVEFWWYVAMLQEFRPSFVYCELFSLRTSVTTSDVLSPVVVRTVLACAMSHAYGDTHADIMLGGVSASMAKSTVTDERMRAQGYWVSGSDHIRDAYRQVLVHKAK